MTKISVVIVSYNVRQFLQQCIDSLLKSDFDLQTLEIIVVDNNSVDGSIEIVANQYPHVKCIANAVNLGFSKANNQGIQIAKGEYILILNPDTLVQEDTLKQCVNFMEKHPNCGVAGVTMLDGSGRYLPESKRGEPTLWNSFTKFSGLTSLFPTSKLLAGYYLGHLDQEKEHVVDVLCGAFMFFRKNVLLECGGFDEDYFMYGEDIDLSLQVRKRGWKVMYLPYTRIIHFKGESTKKTSYSYVKNFYSAMKIYVAKNYTGWKGSWMKLFLNAVITTIAIYSFLKNILLGNIRMFLDAVLIFSGTQVLKQWWGSFHFHSTDYFNNLPSYYNNLGITIIYTFNLWFFGQYDANWKIKRQVIAVGLSFVLSLAIYAMLPSALRSSRIIILISALLGLIIPFMTKILFERVRFSWSGTLKKTSSYLIVASKEKGKIIQNLLESTKPESVVLGFLSPEKEAQNLDPFYLNTYKNLNSVAKTTKADHIIFCSEDLENQTILELMVLPESEVRYSIASIEKMTLIDSKNKNTEAVIYETTTAYHLSQHIYRRIKRAFDIVVSIFFFLFLPILIFHNKYRSLVLPYLLKVVSGKKTWVGYQANSTMEMIENNLPILPQGIFTNRLMMNNHKYFPILQSQNSTDTYYAKNYHPYTDLEMLIKNLASQ